MMKTPFISLNIIIIIHLSSDKGLFLTLFFWLLLLLRPLNDHPKLLSLSVTSVIRREGGKGGREGREGGREGREGGKGGKGDIEISNHNIKKWKEICLPSCSSPLDALVFLDFLFSCLLVSFR